MITTDYFQKVGGSSPRIPDIFLFPLHTLHCPHCPHYPHCPYCLKMKTMWTQQLMCIAVVSRALPGPSWTACWRGSRWRSWWRNWAGDRTSPPGRTGTPTSQIGAGGHVSENKSCLGYYCSTPVIVPSTPPKLVVSLIIAWIHSLSTTTTLT